MCPDTPATFATWPVLGRHPVTLLVFADPSKLCTHYNVVRVRAGRVAADPDDGKSHRGLRTSPIFNLSAGQ